MSEMTYQDLEQQFFKFYDAKEYTQVLALLEREHSHFPKLAAEMYYNWICVAALAGKLSFALQLFKRVLDQGYWFAPKSMLIDNDLVSLHDLPAFKELLDICAQRMLVAQATVKPELIVLQPKQQAGVYPLLIHLHGNGGNAQKISSQWTRTTMQSWLLAFPQSSQIVGPDEFVWDDREKSTSEIREHLATLIHEYAIDRKRIVLSGFSMGASQAIFMALRQEIKTLGFVVFAPFFSELEQEALPALLAKNKNTNLRGYILIGEEDTLCLDGSRKFVEMMQASNFSCKLHILPGVGHSYPPDFAERVAQGLAFIKQK